MKTIRLLLTIILSLVLVHCSSDSSDDTVIDPIDQTDDDPIVLSSAKELMSFSVTKADNSDLDIDANVQQSGTSVKLFFPAGIDLTSLVTSFQVSEKAVLKINGANVVSGNTAIDFSSDFTVVVEAEDGSTQNYSFTVESNFSEFDSAVEAVRSKYNAPGLQIAITKDEKLVYTNNYGFSNLDNTEPVTNNSLFRVASISKPITAITILKMADDGLLSLSDTVFGGNGILGTDFGTPPYKTNIENITVMHLLDHTSGFTNNPYDPMFANLDWSQKQIIDDVLDNWTLATVPGSTYYYSNFGYLVLGRIIEKVSGMSYEDYVKQSILIPAGITNMTTGGNLLNDKKENEVEYFGQETLGAYEMNVTRMDAHGGWIASATDLAKLLVIIDRESGVEDLVTTSNLNLMYFGYEYWWFAGSIPGTSAVFGRLNGDFNYVILANTRTLPDIFAIISEMEAALSSNIPNRTSWPEYDLFTIE